MKRALLVSLLVCPICFWAARSLAASDEVRSGRASRDRSVVAGTEAPAGIRPRPVEGHSAPAEALISRAQSSKWSMGAFQVGREIIRMSRDKAARLLEPVYRGIEEPLRRWHFIRGVVQSGPCPLYHEVIRLMLDDPDPTLRQRGVHKAEDLSFRYFRGLDGERELANWRETYAKQPPRVAYLDGMRELAQRIAGRSGEVEHELILLNLDSNWNTARCCGLHIRDAAVRTGLTRALVDIAMDDRRDKEVRHHAILQLAHVDPGRDVLEPLILELRSDEVLGDTAISTLGNPPKDWGADLLLHALENPVSSYTIEAALDALAVCADARAVPYLVAFKQLEREHLGAARALNLLTGGWGKPLRSAEWWLAWWETNRFEFDEFARDIDVAALVSSLRAQRDGR